MAKTEASDVVYVLVEDCSQRPRVFRTLDGVMAAAEDAIVYTATYSVAEVRADLEATGTAGHGKDWAIDRVRIEG